MSFFLRWNDRSFPRPAGLRFFKVGAFAAMVAAGAASGYGCSVCGCTLSSDWAAQGFDGAPGFEASLRYEYSESSQLRGGGGAISGSDPFVAASAGETQQSTYNNTAILGIDYATGGPWGVSIELPFIHRTHSTIGAGDAEASTSSASGLGDLRVLGRYQRHSMRRSWGIQFGLKLPTGGFNQNFDSGPEAGELLDRGLQLGTGTTDLLLGASYFTRWGAHVGAFASVTGDQPLAERDGYLPSASLAVNTGIRYLNTSWLTPQLQINTRFDERERGPEGDGGNSGGTFVYLSPGVTADIGENAHAFVFFQVPLYQYVNGVQLEPRWLLSLGVRCKL